MKRLRLWILIAVFAMVAVMAALWWWVEPATAVRVAQAQRGPAVQVVYATGIVEPAAMAEVSAQIAAPLEAIFKSEGETVEKGMALAQLDARESRAQLREIEARAEFLLAQVNRYRPLLERGFVSRAAYERAASELAQAQAAARAQRQRIADHRLIAPMAGRVLRRNGEVGEFVTAGRTLFWIGDATRLRVTADVDEEDIGQVAVGQSALVQADAFPGRAFEARVESVTPLGDALNQTYRVRLALADDAQALALHMTVEINIVTARRDNALIVPTGALRENHLYVVRDGIAARQAVEAGIRGLDWTEIRAGIAEGATVIVDPPDGLQDGDAVTIERSAP